MSKWFNGNETLTHNCLFNFIIGSRGVGKTYWGKDRAIQNFLKNKAQFIYLRRYKEELKGEKLKRFFSAVEGKYPDIKFKVKGKEFYINDELAGFAVALSTAGSLKSDEFPKVTFILFDEFLLENGAHKYLPDEVSKFLGLYETIARMRDNVITFFMANATTVTNPYFQYFNIQLPYGSTFYKKGDILFQYVSNQEYTEDKKRTRFGRIIEGTEFAGYAIDNNFLLDNTHLIEKKSGKADFLFSMAFKGNILGVWVNWNEGKLWVSNDVVQGMKIHYSITLEDHSENTILIKSLYRSSTFKTFLESYKVGKVFFENMNIKNLTYEIIRMTMR